MDGAKRRKSIARLSVFSLFRPLANEGIANVQLNTDSSQLKKTDSAAATPIVQDGAPNQNECRSGEDTPLPARSSKPSGRILSRSRTILKFLVTKIRPKMRRPVVVPPLAAKTRRNSRPPPPINTDAAKERREAALRERGLLPPLKPNKDLSRLEMEQDQHLPVVQPVVDGSVGAEGIETATPANLIKKEWEAKNRTGEDEERERLKSFRFGVESPSVSEPQARGQPSTHVGLPVTSAPEAPAPSGVTLTTTGDPAPALGTLITPGFPANNDTSFPLERAAEEVENLSVAPTTLSRDHGCLSATLVPLPPSPTPSRSLLVRPELPTLTITTPVSPAAGDAAPSEGFAVLRSDSSQTSLVTPSLDTPQSVALPLLSPADSSFRLATPLTGSIMAIPTIVESPIEEGPLPEQSISKDSHLDIIDEPYRVPKAKSRRATRTFSGDDQLGKRLVVSASLMNVRRSVSATLARTRSHMTIKGSKQGEMLDSSHSPSSTLFPPLRATTLPLPSLKDAAVAPRQRRTAVAPTLHSRGSILAEMSAIEDDEARRVAELAFLG